MSSRRACQRGFTLVETLLAAAIAAGVIAAAATGLSGAARLTAAARQEAVQLREAAIIAARLRAGLDDREALAGLAGWRIVRAPLERDGPRRGAYFEVATVSDEDGFSYSVLVPITEDRS